MSRNITGKSMVKISTYFWRRLVKYTCSLWYVRVHMHMYVHKPTHICSAVYELQDRDIFKYI